MKQNLMTRWVKMIILYSLFFSINSFGQYQVPAAPNSYAYQTVWNGDSWSNGEPNALMKAVFNANFYSKGAIVANEIEIKEGVVVTINNGDILIDCP